MVRSIAIATWRHPGYLALGLCLVAFVAAAAVATNVFDRVPHVEDELAFLFEARTIAAGRIVAAAPASPDFFAAPFVLIRDGHWFGKYPLGYPIVLAGGALLGQSWLINPLFGALAVGLVYVAGRRFYGATTGLLAAALAVASPFFLLQAGSLLSHAVSLCWAMAFLLLFENAWRRAGNLPALAAGGVLGMLFLTRPLTAVAIALPFVLLTMARVAKAPRRFSICLVMAVGLLPFLAFYLGYNALTTGDPLRSAYELYWPYDRIGFGPDVGVAGHTLQLGLRNTEANLNALADYLFGWPNRLSVVPAAIAAVAAIGGILCRGFVALYYRRRGRAGVQRDEMPRALADGGVTMPARREARDTMVAWIAAAVARAGAPSSDGPARPSPLERDFLLLAIVASLILVYIAYWTPGDMYGPRYYFEALGALVLLSARGILACAAALGAGASRFMGRRSARVRTWSTMATLVATGLLVWAGSADFGRHEFAGFTRWYNIDAAGLKAVRAAGIENAVVFVAQTDWTGYAPFFSENAPTLDSSVVYARDLGADRDGELMAEYAGRSFYRLVGGGLTPISPGLRDLR